MYINKTMEDDEESYSDGSMWSYDSEEAEQIDNVYYEDEDYQEQEIPDGGYVLGLCKYYGGNTNDYILVNKVSVSSFFKFLYEDVISFLRSYSLINTHYTDIDLIKLQYTYDNEGSMIYRCVIKTGYIRIIQRAWRRVLKRRREIWKKRCSPKYLIERQIHGYWISSEIAELPSIYGMLN